MAACDFVVQYPGNMYKLTEVIIENLTLHRIQANKPVIILLTGDSGEGKSYLGLKIMDIVLAKLGIDLVPLLEDLVILTPLEYSEKMKNIFRNPAFKRIPIIMIDEARELVGARNWFSYINQAINAVNAMSRGIKPVVFIVITQYIGDIESATKRTVQFYGECSRPLHQHVRLKLYRLYKDTSDVEHPRLKKRRLRGYVQNRGRYQGVKSTFFVSLPRKELIDIYEPMQRAAKLKLIDRRLELLFERLKKEQGEVFNKVEAMANWYAANRAASELITEYKRKKTRLKPDFIKAQNFTPEEVKYFEKRLNEKKAEKGFALPTELEEVADDGIQAETPEGI